MTKQTSTNNGSGAAASRATTTTTVAATRRAPKMISNSTRMTTVVEATTTTTILADFIPCLGSRYYHHCRRHHHHHRGRPQRGCQSKQRRNLTQSNSATANVVLFLPGPARPHSTTRLERQNQSFSLSRWWRQLNDVDVFLFLRICSQTGRDTYRQTTRPMWAPPQFIMTGPLPVRLGTRPVAGFVSLCGLDSSAGVGQLLGRPHRQTDRDSQTPGGPPTRHNKDTRVLGAHFGASGATSGVRWWDVLVGAPDRFRYSRLMNGQRRWSRRQSRQGSTTKTAETKNNGRSMQAAGCPAMAAIVVELVCGLI